MILQTHKRFREEIQRFGCYFMSLFFLASQKAGKTFTADDIELGYQAFIKHEWMGNDCYIYYPGAILRYLGLLVDYEGKRVGHEPCRKGGLEILCFRRSYMKKGKLKSYKHFCVGDGLGHVAYDPIGESNAVKKGHLESKRIFLRRG